MIRPDPILRLLDETSDALRAVEDFYGRAADPVARGAQVEMGEAWETKMRETIAAFECKFTLLLYEHNARVRG